MNKTVLHFRRFQFLFLANLIAVGVVVWIWWPRGHAVGPLRVTVVAFADLPGWAGNDSRAALDAWRRSCQILARSPLDRPMGGAGYAGTIAQWLPACRALPAGNAQAEEARRFFERWFAPLAIGAGSVTKGLFTGYYEPMLAGSWSRSQRFQYPIYARPTDLITADLGEFKSALAGQRIEGRVETGRLEPYPARADIDAHGLPQAHVVLYTDDPVSAFFLHIQGSGRVRFADGAIARLAFAGTNGRPYTPIGRVLVAQGALDLSNVSLQTIAAWLRAHPKDARGLMESDQSYVFFSLSPLGDPSLGSPGTEGAPLAPGASLAVDARIHPLGAPFYLVATVPDADPSRPDREFSKVLIAQDTGGAIKGAVRGDVFWGFGALSEAIAGRMKSQGRLYVFVPKPVAATLAPYKDFPEAAQ